MIEIVITLREIRNDDLAIELDHEFVEIDFTPEKRTPTIFALWQLSRKFDLNVRHKNADLRGLENPPPDHTTNAVFNARISVGVPGNGKKIIERIQLPQATSEDGEEYADEFLAAINAVIASVRKKAHLGPLAPKAPGG